MFQKLHRVDEKLQQTVLVYFEEMAKGKDYFKNLNFSEILPLSLVKEIKVDMFWAAFKHVCMIGLL